MFAKSKENFCGNSSWKMTQDNLKQTVIKLKRRWETITSNCSSDTLLRKSFLTCKSNKERYRKLRESVTPHQLLNEIQLLIHERQQTLKDLDKICQQAKNYQQNGERYLEKRQYELALKAFSDSICSVPYFVKNEFVTVESGHENKSWQFSSGSNGENSESDDERGLLMNHETSGTKSSQLLEQCRLCLLQSLSLRAEILRQFGYYKLSSEDIKTAMKLNPTNMSMREKLLELQEESLSKLELDINQQHTQYLPTLAYSEHNMIAHASSLTTVNCTKEKGRFLEASGNIRAGDVLIVEPPYASILLPEFYKSHCYHCLKQVIAPVPCYCCSDVRFCSEICQEKALTQYHQYECKIWPFIQMVDEFCHLSIRILLMTDVSQLREIINCHQQNSSSGKENIAGCTSSGQYRGDYTSVFSLVTNSELQPQEALMTYALTASVAATVLAGVFPSSPQQSQNKILRTSHSSPNLLRHQSIRSQYPLYKLNSLADAFAHLTGSNGLPQIKKLSSENRKDNFYSPTFDKFCTLKLEGSENQNRSMSWCELSECQPFSEDCTCSSCAYLSPEEIGCVLLHHLQQMSCNVHTVTTLTEIRNEGSNLIGESADHMRYKQKSSVVRKEHRRIALAIYPTASLLNHACDPDVIVSFVDGHLVVRATHNINPGEEITHCYGPHVGEMMRTARQKMLQKNYFFTCQCAACHREEERERRQLCSLPVLCPDCQTVLKVSFEEGTFIGRCSDPACQKSSDVTQRLQQVQSTREMFLTASDAFELGDIRQSLTILQEVLKKRAEVLPPKDRLVVEVHDAMSRCYAALGEWALASYHCSFSTQAAEKKYGESSPEYAHELHKLAQFLYKARVGQKAMNVVERGIKVLTKLYGRDHPAVKELTNMKQCLRNFGSPVSQFAL